MRYFTKRAAVFIAIQLSILAIRIGLLSHRRERVLGELFRRTRKARDRCGSAARSRRWLERGVFSTDSELLLRELGVSAREPRTPREPRTALHVARSTRQQPARRYLGAGAGVCALPRRPISPSRSSTCSSTRPTLASTSTLTGFCSRRSWTRGYSAPRRAPKRGQPSFRHWVGAGASAVFARFRQRLRRRCRALDDARAGVHPRGRRGRRAARPRDCERDCALRRRLSRARRARLLVNPPIPVTKFDAMKPTIRAIDKVLDDTPRIVTLNRIDEMRYPDELFFDSGYHLTRAGGERRTRLSIGCEPRGPWNWVGSFDAACWSGVRSRAPRGALLRSSGAALRRSGARCARAPSRVPPLPNVGAADCRRAAVARRFRSHCRR